MSIKPQARILIRGFLGALPARLAVSLGIFALAALVYSSTPELVRFPTLSAIATLVLCGTTVWALGGSLSVTRKLTWMSEVRKKYLAAQTLVGIERARLSYMEGFLSRIEQGLSLLSSRYPGMFESFMADVSSKSVIVVNEGRDPSSSMLIALTFRWLGFRVEEVSHTMLGTTDLGWIVLRTDVVPLVVSNDSSARIVEALVKGKFQVREWDRIFIVSAEHIEQNPNALFSVFGDLLGKYPAGLSMGFVAQILAAVSEAATMESVPAALADLKAWKERRRKESAAE